MRALALGFCLALGVAATPVRADTALPFKVVAHPDVPVNAVSKEFLAHIYLRSRNRWTDGEKTKPVDNAGLRAIFAKVILDRDLDDLKAFWDQQVFAGKGVPPPEKPTDKEVATYIAANPGAVGYLSANVKVVGLKELKVTGVGEDK